MNDLGEVAPPIPANDILSEDNVRRITGYLPGDKGTNYEFAHVYLSHEALRAQVAALTAARDFHAVRCGTRAAERENTALRAALIDLLAMTRLDDRRATAVESRARAVLGNPAEVPGD